MPLFGISDGTLRSIKSVPFSTEKELQRLVECSLGEIFNCRFVASEFSTGSQHGGRIDTLALSEENNPVILEYKKVESSELINQSLFYLAWISDHRGDFEIAAQKALGIETEIDWSEVRVICIAPNYRKYDLHAVHAMGANLELWSFRRFTNGTIYFEEIFKKSVATKSSVATDKQKNPTMVEAGKKAYAASQANSYTYEQHIENKPTQIVEVAEALREFVMGLDPSIEEVPKKWYVAYRSTQNIICAEIQKQKLRVYAKLDPAVATDAPDIVKDVSNTGHMGTGDVELTIRSLDDLEMVKPFIELAYQNVGG